jgi:hypothetical protein
MYFILTALVLTVPIVADDLPHPDEGTVFAVYPGWIRTKEKERSPRAEPKRRVLRHAAAAPVSSSLSLPVLSSCSNSRTATP